MGRYDSAFQPQSQLYAGIKEGGSSTFRRAVKLSPNLTDYGVTRKLTRAHSIRGNGKALLAVIPSFRIHATHVRRSAGM